MNLLWKSINHKRNILVGFVACLVLSTSMTALAAGKRVIPDVGEVQSTYGSVELLLNPCSNVMDDDKEFADQVNDARKDLPLGTCDDPQLVNKLFKARFLQLSLLTMMQKPWELDKEITIQDKTISQCKDTKCLDKALTTVINKLAPMYENYILNTKKPNSICTANFSPVTAKKYKLIESKLIEELNSTDNCNVADAAGLIDNGVHYFDYTDVIPTSGGVGYKTCKSNLNDLFIASCPSFGNDANTQSWIYRLKQDSKPELLFEAAANEGQFYELATSCNEMPDLMTSARYNMGEHLITFYQYDGNQYQMVYSYMEEYNGDDSSGNNLMIATDIEKGEYEINCHIKQ